MSKHMTHIRTVCTHNATDTHMYVHMYVRTQQYPITKECLTKHKLEVVEVLDGLLELGQLVSVVYLDSAQGFEVKALWRVRGGTQKGKGEGEREGMRERKVE